ncbi:MAG TPA: HNH endonuclease [Patescibacteria group bacterium]|nr:HNH endonuclease [Patescibacteria group bacterium]
MNFGLHGGQSVVLMSRRRGAPYEDRLEEDGRVLIYEGHDATRSGTTGDPKAVDQPHLTPSGRATQNALFYEAAGRYKRHEQAAEKVRVYEKIKQGIWVYNGTFLLTDAWNETSSGRRVFRFRLELGEDSEGTTDQSLLKTVHQRMIPTFVKLEVWKRDRGCCVLCGSAENLHFDHDIPFSKGGSSITPKNIRLLCAKHNLAKHDHIE